MNKITAETLLTYVRTQIGVKETPINQVIYNDWYYGRHVEGPDYKWCVTGPMYSFNYCGMPLPIKTASTTTLMNYAKKVGRFYTNGYKPGDIGFCTTKAGKHTFIIERVYENGLDTIEFNLDDQVKHNYRRVDTILGAYRPEYEEGEDMTYQETKDLILSMVPEIVEDILIKDMNNVASAAPGEWSKADREWATQNGLIVGDDTGMHWKSPATREQLAAILHRLADLLEGQK